MPNLCNEISKKINCLPHKDIKICKEYFKKRDFESILEIAESALTMKKRDISKQVHQKKWEKIDILDLEELVYLTREYLSYLDIDVDNNDEYYD